jgi:WXXGXW repeat (2 copies)
MKRMLRALAFSGILGAAAVAAQAQIGVYVGVAPVAPVVSEYVPPCPGVDFVWTPGYYAGRVWVAGRWAHRSGYVARADHFDYAPRDGNHHGYDRRGGWDHRR